MFNYKTFEELQAKLNALGVSLPFSDDLSVLSEKYVCPEFTLANRFAIHPLEGCDGTADGSPDEQTKRRYVPTPEERIRTLKKRIRVLVILWLITLALLAAALYPALEYFQGRRFHQTGQNYSTFTDSTESTR